MRVLLYQQNLPYFLSVDSHLPVIVGNFAFSPEAAQQKASKADNFLEILVLNPSFSIISVTYLPKGIELQLV